MFPTNPDLADILGAVSILIIFMFFLDPKIPDFQVPDFQKSALGPGLGLGPGWAPRRVLGRAGGSSGGPGGPSAGPRVGRGVPRGVLGGSSGGPLRWIAPRPRRLKGRQKSGGHFSRKKRRLRQRSQPFRASRNMEPFVHVPFCYGYQSYLENGFPLQN